MQSVYIETTIPSYLTAWPARNLIAAAHQAITREWWALRRDTFQLFVSQLVITEASAGDPAAAQLRLDAVEGIPLLPSTDSVEWIANELERLGLVHANAAADAFHVAFASVHALDYLLTWNCRHIANAERLPAIEVFLRDNGFAIPNVCTPEELMGDVDTTNA
ncbi:MAG: type II toxin-antitoxin system VapC family toxin [Planctomycetota bacterium]